MRDAMTAIILAGGRATRMGGVDKGLMHLHEKPLITHVMARLSPQVSDIVINANRSLDQYALLGLPILQDENPNYLGPLAGFMAGLKYTQHMYLLTVPCDSPNLPRDLAERMLAQLLANNAELAVAKSEGNTHPVICLCKASVLPSLESYIARGERKVSTWQTSLRSIEVDFSDCPDAFANINTLDDLQHLAHTFVPS